MNQKKISSRVYQIVKSALAAAILPVFLIYIMIDKPDYRIMNAASHVVLPVANWVGDVVSWPIRAIGNAVGGIRELSNLHDENEELRAKLDENLQARHEYDVAISENQRLRRELDIARAMPQKVIVAGVSYDNSAFHHNTFFINKGVNAGIEAGMAVVSFDRVLVGIVSDVGANFARVRALADSKSNIPVRIAGSEVYGFLAGNGSDGASIGFLSDPEFQATPGLKLITSSIRGVLPDGIYVGEMTNDKDVNILPMSRVSDVMVLQFNNKDRYK